MGVASGHQSDGVLAAFPKASANAVVAGRRVGTHENMQLHFERYNPWEKSMTMPASRRSRHNGIVAQWFQSVQSKTY